MLVGDDKYRVLVLGNLVGIEEACSRALTPVYRDCVDADSSEEQVLCDGLNLHLVVPCAL